MNIEETRYSGIAPVQEHKVTISIEDIERELLNILAKNDYNLVTLYNSYNTRSNNTPLKDILLNLEQLLKVNFLEDEKKLFISNNVFETIKAQLKILESLDESSASKSSIQEISTVLFATIFSYFKKYFI
jgi:hypothetical protein